MLRSAQLKYLTERKYRNIIKWKGNINKVLSFWYFIIYIEVWSIRVCHIFPCFHNIKFLSTNHFCSGLLERMSCSPITFTFLKSLACVLFDILVQNRICRYYLFIYRSGLNFNIYNFVHEGTPRLLIIEQQPIKFEYTYLFDRLNRIVLKTPLLQQFNSSPNKTC